MKFHIDKPSTKQIHRQPFLNNGTRIKLLKNALYFTQNC